MRSIETAATVITITTTTANPYQKLRSRLSLLSRLSLGKPLFADVSSIYAAQVMGYVVPLFTVPYLSRVLGPAAWGLFAIAQSFASYGGLVVEYGFLYYGTRSIAGAGCADAVESVVPAITGAKLLLSCATLAAAALLSLIFPPFRLHRGLIGTAVIAEIVRALIPNYYFYGRGRIALASTFEIAARLSALLGVFVLVRQPIDAWRVFALQALGSAIAVLVSHRMIYRDCGFSRPDFRSSVSMLRHCGDMFLFRGAHSVYILGNAFLLGFFAPAATVGVYAGAEKINAAASGLLSPLSTALYPRASNLLATSVSTAARLTRMSFYVMVAGAGLMSLFMFIAGPVIIRLVLGPEYSRSVAPFQILSLRVPLIAIVNVLGFQWLLAIGGEKMFGSLTTAALVANIVLCVALAPAYGASGMAAAVVLSQTITAFGIPFMLRRRGLSPFRGLAEPAHA